MNLVDLEGWEGSHLHRETVFVLRWGKQLHYLIDGTARDHLL